MSSALEQIVFEEAYSMLRVCLIGENNREVERKARVVAFQVTERVRRKRLVQKAEYLLSQGDYDSLSALTEADEVS